MPWSDLAIVPQVLALSAELSIEENLADCAPATRVRLRCDERWSSSASPSWRRGRSAKCRWASSSESAVARAMVADPKVLLADEPTSFQDDALTEGVVRALRSAADRGTAVLVATHDDGVAGAADRVIELSVFAR